jgi:hypothetical protein
MKKGLIAWCWFFCLNLCKHIHLALIKFVYTLLQFFLLKVHTHDSLIHHNLKVIAWGVFSLISRRALLMFVYDIIMCSNNITGIRWGWCEVTWFHIFLLFFFSSPELKAQVSFSDRPLSVVCLAVCLSVCLLNIYIFDFFRTAGPISTRLGTKHPWAKGIQNCTNEGQPPSPRGDNSERVKIYWKLLKIFFRTSRPISIKLGTNHP